MAEVRVDFTISADENLITLVDKIMDAIADVGYGIDTGLDEDSGEIEVSAEAVDLAGVCGWMAIIRRIVTVQNPCLLQDDLSVPSKSSCQSFISADTVLPACANV